MTLQTDSLPARLKAGTEDCRVDGVVDGWTNVTTARVYYDSYPQNEFAFKRCPECGTFKFKSGHHKGEQ